MREIQFLAENANPNVIVCALPLELLELLAEDTRVPDERICIIFSRQGHAIACSDSTDSTGSTMNPKKEAKESGHAQTPPG